MKTGTTSGREALRVAVRTALVALALVAWRAAAEAQAYPPIMGFQHVQSPNFKAKVPPIPFWNGMLGHWQNGAACQADAKGSCTTAGWNEALAKGKNLTGLPLLRAINDAFNSYLFRYAHDQDIWQLPDYWETPYQFLARGGDCEDFAIAKYMALKALGVPEQNMLIVTVMRKVQRDGHAILVVLDGQNAWVLDILNSHVMPQSAAQVSYMPLMGINGRLWLYIHNMT
jgi:predicted transglutaminase-like cysteine proteinase